GNGGGIYNTAGGWLWLTRTHVHSNRAGQFGDGGGVYNLGGLEMSGGTGIYSNIAAHQGGGRWEWGTLARYNSQAGTQMYGNGAQDGGGIWARGTLTFHGGLIEGNTASRNGGGLYTEVATALLDQGVSIRSNSAQKGGAAYAKSGTLTLDACFV